MKPIPLFGTGVQANSAAITSQRRLNCFYTPRPDGDQESMVIRGTPGSALWITLPQSPIRGWHTVGTTLYAVANRNLYSVTAAGTVTPLGVLNTTSGRVEIADNGTQLCLVDGTNGYYFTIAGSVFGQIVDANFPNGATSVTYLNGRFTVEKAGSRQAYTGQIYDATLWTPVIFFTKENDSSILLAVENTNGTLVLWGAASMEFWQDVGSTPLPYSRVSGTTQDWGLAATASRANLDNTLVFLGQNSQGYAQILRLDGYVPKRISTSDIENIINSFSRVDDAVALTYMVDGQEMYQITFPSGNRSFLYDSLSKIWSEVQTGLDPVGRHFGNLGIVFNARNFMSDVSTGNIYQIEPDIYTDNGQPIKRQIRTRHIRNGGNTFAVSELYLNMETGVGLQAGQGSDPQMLICVSKDEGRTYGPERSVSLGKVGEYKNPRVVTRRWGRSRDFVWQFTVTDPVKFVVLSGSLSVSGREGKGE